MAQAPRPGIPPAAPGASPPTQQPASRTQVNIHGQAPQSQMAPPDDEDTPEGLGDNTKAEMQAGKTNLQQHSKRHNAEHEAGRRANQQRSGNRNPSPDPDAETNPLE